MSKRRGWDRRSGTHHNLVARSFLIAAVLVGTIPTQAQSPHSPSQKIGLSPGCTEPTPSATPARNSTEVYEEGNKRYREITALKDQKEKTAALEKYLVDFPTHYYAGEARILLLEAAIKEMPKDKDKGKALEMVEATLQSLDRPTSTQLHRLGHVLSDAGFKERAEQVTEMSVSEANRAAADSVRIYDGMKSDALEHLGRMQYENKKFEAAEKTFQLAYALDPNRTTLPWFLATLAERRNANEVALEYWLSGGTLTKADRDQMEKLYRKLHNNSLEGLEAEIDAHYEKMYGGLVKTEPFQATAARSTRVALAEVFSGAGCRPCVGADLAFEAMLKRYKTSDVAIIFYHQHTPVPDPLANRASVARYMYYNPHGVPAAFLDGAPLPPSGGDRQMAAMAYNRLLPKIDKQLNAPAELELRLDAKLQKGVVVVSVKTSKPKALPNTAAARVVAASLSPTAESTVEKCAGAPHQLRLHIALVEDRVYYAGENGIRYHSMTVRDMATPDGLGAALNEQGIGRASVKFELSEVSARLKSYLTDYQTKESMMRDKDKPFKFSAEPNRMDSKHLAVVAFVQDDATKNVLQAQMVSLTPSRGESL